VIFPAGRDHIVTEAVVRGGSRRQELITRVDLPLSTNHPVVNPADLEKGSRDKLIGVDAPRAARDVHAGLFGVVYRVLS